MKCDRKGRQWLCGGQLRLQIRTGINLEKGEVGLVAQDDIKALTSEITRVVADGALRSHLTEEGRKPAMAFVVEIAPLWLAEVCA